jgi:hypothetical protein
MATTVGSVSVATDGTVTKSGAAEAVYDKLVADYSGTIPSGADGVPHKQSFADIANGCAALVGYMTTNVEVVIGTSDSGLQRDPSSTDPTLAPAAEKTLTIR